MKLKSGLVGFMLVIACGSAYVWSQDGKISINSEAAQLILLKGGYRSWGLRYSDGSVYKNGAFRAVSFDMNADKTTTLRDGYHFPRFEHSDLRPYLRKVESTNAARESTNAARTVIINLWPDGSYTLGAPTNATMPP